RAGTSFEVEARVRNEGKTDARATTTRVVLSTDTALGAADVELCTLATPPVPAGDHLDRTLTGRTIPPGFAPGNAHLILQVDAPPSVEVELDERNNLLAAAFRVDPPLPDLEVRKLLVPEGVLAGEAITVQYTVRNDGHAAAGASTLDVRLSA